MLAGARRQYERSHGRIVVVAAPRRGMSSRVFGSASNRSLNTLAEQMANEVTERSFARDKIHARAY